MSAHAWAMASDVSGKGLVQFLQHAHHRVEGWLIELEERLEQGRIEAQLFERASKTLYLHMYAEEEIIFPHAGDARGHQVAELKEQHGRISDLVEEMQGLIAKGGRAAAVRERLSRLLGVLAAHNAAEDLGVYPDIVALLGYNRAQILLRKVERADPPPGWRCATRRGRHGERPQALPRTPSRR